MGLESTLSKLKNQIEQAISDYGSEGVAPPMHLLEMRSYLLSGSVADSTSNFYQQLLNAPDLIKTVEYADIGDPNNERVTSVTLSSASMGISFTDTHLYEGLPGAYRIVRTERTQKNA